MTYCDTCGHQFSDVCGTCESLEGVPVKYRKKTNADRIRSMDNNQLSELLQRQICGICILFYYCQAHRDKRPCSEVIDEWLKQEAET